MANEQVFSPGTKVRWFSQAGGSWTEKLGTVIAHLPPNSDAVEAGEPGFEVEVIEIEDQLEAGAPRPTNPDIEAEVCCHHVEAVKSLSAEAWESALRAPGGGKRG